MEDYDRHSIHSYLHDKKKTSNNYYLNDKYHRLNGPAFTLYYHCGSIEVEHYARHGQFYREDGPSHIEYYKNGNICTELYRSKYSLHRIDGPAEIHYNKDGTVNVSKYFIFGEECSKEEFETPGFVDAFILEHS